MTRTIYFDMDGTIANFYGVEGWLEDLMNSNTRPYEIAKPLLNFSSFARQLHRLQNSGYRIGIVSWLSKSGSPEFNAEVTATKLKWLAKHLPSVEWDEIKIVTYGTPKSSVVSDRTGFLFDDEERNRTEWGANAFDVQNIMEILRSF
jgi:hypothetical protein